MSRSRYVDTDDRDPIALAADAVRPDRCEVDDIEPPDFDDVRMARRFGVVGGHFPGLDAHNDLEDW